MQSLKIKKSVQIENELIREESAMEKEAIKASFFRHLVFTQGCDTHSAEKYDYYMSMALAIRDRLIQRWIQSQQAYYKMGAKRVYYLSLEFLMGRSLGNSIINLQTYDTCHQALEELGIDLEELRDVEMDAGLGNGGLGRLAACFLDSLSSLSIPAVGYGIRYEYGIFTQKIENGYQVETTDKWLQYGNPWEIARHNLLFPVKFYGRVDVEKDSSGKEQFKWVDGHDVYATPYDMPIPGYGNNAVNTLRLWAAKATNEFDLNFFNSGDYVSAVENKNQDENISRVLYPNDNFAKGKELRLKQQHFFVSATLQDIIRRYKRGEKYATDFEKLHKMPDKIAIQLNDTHPVIAIPEMMRLLMDNEKLEWDESWEIVTHVFNYTNHTVMPEALEKWPFAMLEQILPRHAQIILEINRRLVEEVKKRYPNDPARVEKMAIISNNGDPQVRMANLAIVSCNKVNGVAALHTKILREKVFPEFDEFYPSKFINVTNGITHRRWLKKCNTHLASLINKQIGDEWINDLSLLKNLEPFADDALFKEKFHLVKRQNKIRLAEYIRKKHGMDVSLDAIFDCQVKRLHEYKRQLLNLLTCIAFYFRIKENPNKDVVPRLAIFSGKSAPGYAMAKLIIKLINSVANVVNNDPVVGDKLKILFLANYSVSLAEKIIPAADISQQISTAGMEASGTGNMKFALNGALTIGTLDGANVEMLEEVGEDNIFIFGLKAEEVEALRKKGYNPWDYYNKDVELKKVLDAIANGYFSPSEPQLFKMIVDSLLVGGDYYMLLADFRVYLDCQEKVHELYRDHEVWYKKAILNTARMGKFSSDRSIREYAEKIWNVSQVNVDEA
jgi:starch phosphorylase